jgi:peroxiredoxin Q/BCP
MGKEYDGVFRTTFLIGPDGVVNRVFANVKPDAHSSEILEAIAHISN